MVEENHQLEVKKKKDEIQKLKSSLEEREGIYISELERDALDVEDMGKKLYLAVWEI